MDLSLEYVDVTFYFQRNSFQACKAEEMLFLFW